MLKYLMENGNSTTYQWRTGEKPEVIEEAKIFIDTSDENEVVQVTDDVSLFIIIYGVLHLKSYSVRTVMTVLNVNAESSFSKLITYINCSMQTFTCFCPAILICNLWKYPVHSFLVNPTDFSV